MPCIKNQNWDTKFRFYFGVVQEELMLALQKAFKIALKLNYLRYFRQFILGFSTVLCYKPISFQMMSYGCYW